jgi:hypothetical protein
MGPYMALIVPSSFYRIDTELHGLIVPSSFCAIDAALHALSFSPGFNVHKLYLK